MSKYPLLQDEVVKICMNHIRSAEQKTKDQVFLKILFLICFFILFAQVVCSFFVVLGKIVVRF